MLNKRLILASASPRRSELLTRVGYKFEVIPSSEEEILESAHPAKAAIAAAEKKARSISEQNHDAVVIGADTLVVYNGNILTKPSDAEDAVRMLRTLSGNIHKVFTGVFVSEASVGHDEEFFEETAVFFRVLSDDEIALYVESGEPLDKAGAYGIQELGACFVRRIEGCYFNVVGLPVPHLYSTLLNFGILPHGGGTQWTENSDMSR